MRDPDAGPIPPADPKAPAREALGEGRAVSPQPPNAGAQAHLVDALDVSLVRVELVVGAAEIGVLLCPEQPNDLAGLFELRDALAGRQQLDPFVDLGSGLGRVVILGQDPYHGEGQAHGLCVSVQPGVKLPASLVNIFNPEIVVIGGGVSEAGELLLEPARAIVKERALAPGRDVVWIVQAEFGAEAGMIGAALAAVAGTMYLMYYGVINFADGFVPGIKALQALERSGLVAAPHRSTDEARRPDRRCDGPVAAIRDCHGPRIGRDAETRPTLDLGYVRDVVARSEYSAFPSAIAYLWAAIGLVGFSLVRSVVIEKTTGIRPDGGRKALRGSRQVAR